MRIEMGSVIALPHAVRNSVNSFLHPLATLSDRCGKRAGG
jgi:hypothetical protein